jgi:hypothetical protein
MFTFIITMKTYQFTAQIEKDKETSIQALFTTCLAHIPKQPLYD